MQFFLIKVGQITALEVDDKLQTVIIFIPKFFFFYHGMLVL